MKKKQTNKETEMKKFTVKVCRISYGFNDIEVDMGIRTFIDHSHEHVEQLGIYFLWRMTHLSFSC